MIPKEKDPFYIPYDKLKSLEEYVDIFENEEDPNVLLVHWMNLATFNQYRFGHRLSKDTETYELRKKLLASVHKRCLPIIADLFINIYKNTGKFSGWERLKERPCFFVKKSL